MTDSGAFGITGYAAYIPRSRLDRKAISAAHQWMAPALRGLAKGERSFCNWDEDAITMAVAAASSLNSLDPVESLVIASTTMPFSELQGSALVAGALGLTANTQTQDFGHSARAATSAICSTFMSGSETLLIASDCPTAKPASAQEMQYGAGAAALKVGTGRPVATLLASYSEHAMFVDHFRTDASIDDYYWEERWIRDEGYQKLLGGAIEQALQRAGIATGDIDHLIVPSPLKDPARGLLKRFRLDAAVMADPLSLDCGFAGSAHPVLMLVNVLEQARADQVIVLAGFGQGADVLVLKTTSAIESYRPSMTVQARLAERITYSDYLRLLSYQGKLELDFGMRAERSIKTALTEQYRSADQLTGFTAGKCRRCGTVQFPQLAYCVNPQCRAARTDFEPYSLADKVGSVLTCTADWLSYHPAPPLYVGFVEFSGGGRLLMEFSDLSPDGIDVGDRVEMAFRRKDLDKQRGYPRYFWKAIPSLAATVGE